MGLVKSKISFSQILTRQIEPSFAMLAKIIDTCPKSIWAQRNIDPPMWQQVFHVLYGMDYWFSKSKKDFSPPKFEPEVNPVLGETSPDFLEQHDTLEYLNHVQIKAIEFIENLTADDLIAPSSIYKKWTNLDVILEQIRHLQHHIGYLNRIILKCRLDPVEWEYFDVH